MKLASASGVAGLVGVVLYVGGAWFTAFLWMHYQLVSSGWPDYLLLLFVGAVPVLFVARSRLHEQQKGWRFLTQKNTWFGFLGAFMFVALPMGGLFRAANALLDSHPAEPYRAVVTGAHCGRSESLYLAGAPTLPTSDNTMTVDLFLFGDIDCLHTHTGDTVTVHVRQGFFGRPWISERSLLHPKW